MPQPLRLLIGSDSAGVDHKDAILADLQQDPDVATVEDLGVPADDLKAHNKVPGIRATVAHDCLSVERSILSPSSRPSRPGSADDPYGHGVSLRTYRFVIGPHRHTSIGHPTMRKAR